MAVRIKGRYQWIEVDDFVSELSRIVTYTRKPLRSETAIQKLFKSRKGYMKQNARTERNSVSVYKVIKQKIRKIKRYLPGQSRRREVIALKRLIPCVEEMLSGLRKRLNEIDEVVDPIQCRQQEINDVRSRVSKRHLKMVV